MCRPDVFCFEKWRRNVLKGKKSENTVAYVFIKN